MAQFFEPIVWRSIAKPIAVVKASLDQGEEKCYLTGLSPPRGTYLYVFTMPFFLFIPPQAHLKSDFNYKWEITMHRAKTTTDLLKKRKPASCFPCLKILQRLRKTKLVSYCARSLQIETYAEDGLGFAAVKSICTVNDVRPFST